MDFVADIAIVALVFATLAVASSWLGAYARIVSFGQAVFFGIGGYAVAVSNLRGGSPWYGALGGALFAVLVAVVCALVCLRGRGVTYAILTLAAGALAEPFVAAHSWIGPGDVFAFPQRSGFLNLQFDAKWPYVLLALCVFGVAQALTFGLRASRAGYYLHALRTNFSAAMRLGIDALQPRLLVIAVASFVTSVAGSLFAEYARAVSPHAMFAMGLSCDIALIGIVAGPRSPWGAALAGCGYALLARVIPLHPAGPPGTAILIAEGAAVVLFAVLSPAGIFARGGRAVTRTAAGSPA